jgi:hypothetical protein
MSKRRPSSLVRYLRVYLTLIFSVLFMSGMKAQDYVITTAESWVANQTLSTNVIVDAGGTLTIAAGVTVAFNYADINADTTGDFRIEVRNGGKLIINGTYANPVVFRGAGAAPPAYASANRWWQGLNLASTTGSSISFLTIKNANNGINVAGALNLNGITVDSSANGIIVNNTLGGTVNLNVPVISNIPGKGIVINNGATNIRYATLSDITDNGIEINTPNVTVDWTTIVNASTGLVNNASATSTVVSNSSFTGNKKSGLFNLDGTVTITNSKFNSNAFNGIVNSSGTLTLTQADMSNNTSRGILLAGAGVSTIKNVTDTANGNVGVDIIPQKQTADLLVPAGTAEATMPTVSFLYSNIYHNSLTSTPANLQVRSLSTSASPVADFTTTWWGVNTGIMDLVSSATVGAINYANWRTVGAYAVVSTANLDPAKSIAISYPVAGQNLLQGEASAVRWTSLGNIPYVIVSHIISTGVAPATTKSYDIVPNTGSFSVTPPTADPSVVFYVKSFSDTTVNSSVSSIVIVTPTSHTISAYAAAPAPRAATHTTVTASTAGLTNGSTVVISGGTGAAAVLNGTFVISNVLAGSFEIEHATAAIAGLPVWSFPAPTMQINRPLASDTLRSSAKFNVKWVAPAVVKNLDIYFSKLGDFSDEIKVGTSVDATTGAYEITVPASVTKGTTAKIKLKDVTPNVTNVSTISSSAFNTFANPPWSFAKTGYSMNLAVDTLIFAASNPNAADATSENADSYIGAFWTNGGGQRVCVGSAQGIDPVVPFSATPVAITAYAAAADPNYTTVSTASTTGLTNGRSVTISGDANTYFNGVFVVSNVVDNTSFDIAVPAIAHGAVAYGTWTLNRVANISGLAAGGGGNLAVTVASTTGLSVGDPITVSQSGRAAYNGTFAISLIPSATVLELATPYVAPPATATTSVLPAPAPRAATHTTVSGVVPATLVNGGTVTIAASHITADNGTYTVSNVQAGSFEIPLARGPVATTTIIPKTGSEATTAVVTVPDATAFGAGFATGDYVSIASSSVAAYNTAAPVAIAALAGNTFEIPVAQVGVAITATASAGGNDILCSTANTTGISVGTSVLVYGAVSADAAFTNGVHLVTAVVPNTSFTFTASSPWSATSPSNYLINDVGTATWAAYDHAHATFTVNEYNVANVNLPDHRYRALTIWGDDPTTTAKEGPADGDNLTFSLYKAGYAPASNPDGILPARFSLDSTIAAAVAGNNDYIGGTDSLATVAYHLNSTPVYFSIFSREGYGQSSSSTTGTVTRSEAYTAAGTWYLYSTNVLPTLTAFAPNPLTGSFMESFGTNMLIAKNGSGNVYWPQYGINDIDANGGWRYDQAYYVKVGNTAGTPGTLNFTLTGQKIVPETSPVSLNKGWNYVPYLRESSMNIGIALSSISKYIVIVKQDDGKVYWPAYSINEIGSMTAGRGYLVKVAEASTLYYPSNSYTAKENVVEESKDAVHFVVKSNSDNSSVIGITADALEGKIQANDEVGVFNSEGVLVGSAVYTGGNLAITVWGLESGAKNGFGMKEGETYSIKVWNSVTGNEISLTNVKYAEGTGVYTNNGISLVSKVEGLSNIVPVEYSVSQNYPNPFNPSTTIKYALPKDSRVKIAVYNILGQVVRELVNTDMKAGYHQVYFNAAGIASGVYFYKIDAGDFHVTKKMNLLK